ncbi:Acetylcholinesterase [Nymphon striatum]|nr:Acetylcholinesterase [Nymphon striatum]
MLVSIDAKDVVVDTSSGAIRGTLETWKNTEVEVFLGIPFGKPPLGNMRFSRPEAIHPWKGIYDATEFKPDCIQEPGWDIMNITETSEDCLYLSIWAPKTQHFKPRPVMFHIFGGGFFVGTSRIEGLSFAAKMDAVVVSSNYRVNAFGFLNMHIDEAPGNMGLLDQQLALEWVKTNIGKFGGDSDSITIFGVSAGGASVGYHLLSPKSRNLFKRAALHSGTPNAVWSFNEVAYADAKAMQLAEFANCDKSDFHANPKRLVQCLKNVSTKTLADAVSKIKLPLPQTFAFAPTLDNHFISDTPYNLLNEGNFKKAEVIIGTTKTEGGGLMKMIYFKEYFVDEFPTVEQLHQIPSQMYPYLEDTQLKEIGLQYYGDQDIKCRKNGTIIASHLIADTGFICPSVEFADAFTKFGGKVFYYQFTHKKIGSNDWDDVPHGADYPYILGQVQESEEYTETEKELSRRMISQLSNFINTGDPSLESYTWPIYTNKEKMYYKLDTSEPESLTGSGVGQVGGGGGCGGSIYEKEAFLETEQQSNAMYDMICLDTVVAVRPNVESLCDYFLLYVTSAGVITLSENVESLGLEYSVGDNVIHGYYYNFVKASKQGSLYKVMEVKAVIIPAGSVVYVGVELQAQADGRQLISSFDDEDIMCFL